jgi:CheY-like chemotaxis protein
MRRAMQHFLTRWDRDTVAITEAKDGLEVLAHLRMCMRELLGPDIAEELGGRNLAAHPDLALSGALRVRDPNDAANAATMQSHLGAIVSLHSSGARGTLMRSASVGSAHGGPAMGGYIAPEPAAGDAAMAPAQAARHGAASPMPSQPRSLALSSAGAAAPMPPRVPALLCLDINMGGPHQGGIHASLELRQWEHALGLARLPVLAVTSSTGRTDVEAYTSAGMDDVTGKPLMREQLVWQVEKLVRRRRVLLVTADAAASARWQRALTEDGHVAVAVSSLAQLMALVAEFGVVARAALVPPPPPLQIPTPAPTPGNRGASAHSHSVSMTPAGAGSAAQPGLGQAATSMRPVSSTSASVAGSAALTSRAAAMPAGSAFTSRHTTFASPQLGASVSATSSGGGGGNGRGGATPGGFLTPYAAATSSGGVLLMPPPMPVPMAVSRQSSATSSSAWAARVYQNGEDNAQHHLGGPGSAQHHLGGPGSAQHHLGGPGSAGGGGARPPSVTATAGRLSSSGLTARHWPVRRRVRTRAGTSRGRVYRACCRQIPAYHS